MWNPTWSPMLTGLFKSNRPAVLLLVPLLVLLVFGSELLVPYVPLDRGPVMPLQGQLERLLLALPWLRGPLLVLLIPVMTVQLSLLLDRTGMLGRTTHLPALLLPLLLGGFARDGAFDAALVGMPLVLAALGSTWSITNNGAALRPLFNAGLFMGLAAMFHLPYAFLVVAVWITVSMVRPFHWREYVVPVVGAAVVFYLVWSVLKLQGATPWRPLLTLVDRPGWSAPSAGPVSNAQPVLLLLLLGVWVIAALPNYMATYQRGVMREKNLRAAFLGFASLCAVLIGAELLMRGHFAPILPAVPLAGFCCFALLGTRRAWLGEAAVIGLLLLALWAQWG